MGEMEEPCVEVEQAHHAIEQSDLDRLLAGLTKHEDGGAHRVGVSEEDQNAAELTKREEEEEKGKYNFYQWYTILVNNSPLLIERILWK